MWEKRGGSRSHNYQSLFDPRAEKIELMPYFSYKPLKHAILFIETSNTCTTALF